MSAPKPDPARVAQLHEALMLWLGREHPRAPALEVLTALTYEVGRIAGMLTLETSDAFLEAMLDQIRDQMREHIAAYRRGLRT